METWRVAKSFLVVIVSAAALIACSGGPPVAAGARGRVVPPPPTPIVGRLAWPQLPAEPSLRLPVAAAAGALSNRLLSEDGTLDVHVGSYSDCTGAAALPYDEAVLDSCQLGRAYFVGHNPGVFTPVMHLRPGDHLRWVDATGVEHRYQVLTVRLMRRNSSPLTLSRADVKAQIQTCETPDGSVVRILDLVST